MLYGMNTFHTAAPCLKSFIFLLLHACILTHSLTMALAVKFGVAQVCLCRCEATFTRRLADEYASKLDINACCPGYVSTDMSSHKGHKTDLQGADTPVWLMLLAPKRTTGNFFSDRKKETF